MPGGGLAGDSGVSWVGTPVEAEGEQGGLLVVVLEYRYTSGVESSRMAWDGRGLYERGQRMIMHSFGDFALSAFGWDRDTDSALGGLYPA